MSKHFSRLMILVAVVVFLAMMFPSQVDAARTPVSITVHTPLPTWGGVNVTVEVTTSGFYDNWQSTSYRYNDTGAWLCMDHTNYTSDGTYQVNMDITTPISAGDHALYMRAHSDDDCSDGTELFPSEPTVTVAKNNPALPSTCGVDVTLVMDESGSLWLEDPPIANDLRHAADALWKSLEATGSTLSIVEFNTEGRLVPSIQNMHVLPGANYTAFTSYMSPTLPYAMNDYTYAPEAYFDSDYYTNWEDALMVADSINGTPKDLLIFVTDGVPTTNNDFPNEDDPVNNFVDSDALRHQHVGPAAIAANGIKSAGTRILGLGVPNPDNPTIDMPFISGPTPFMTTTMNVAEADHATIADADDLAIAMDAIITEICRSSITVNKLVNDPDNPEGPLDTYIFENGWDFEAIASPSADPFKWIAPTASASSTITGTTAGNGTSITGTLTFQWNQEDPNVATTVSISETAQQDAAFVEVTCRYQATQEVITTTSTLPVVLELDYDEFVVCVFYNYRSPTAISLENVGIGSSQSTWIYVAVGSLVVFTAGVIWVLRRKESQTS